MRIIATILRVVISLAVSLVIGIIVMMFRICLAGGGGGSGSASTSSASGSGTNTNRIPSEIKIGDHWYKVRAECTGELKLKRDWGSSTESVEYVARKPNPVLHPNYYCIYDTRGNKVGEFRNT